jgi:hypothetical protein
MKKIDAGKRDLDVEIELKCSYVLARYNICNVMLQSRV